jgi:hypothetical protein
MDIDKMLQNVGKVFLHTIAIALCSEFSVTSQDFENIPVSCCKKPTLGSITLRTSVLENLLNEVRGPLKARIKLNWMRKRPSEGSNQVTESRAKLKEYRYN